MAAAHDPQTLAFYDREARAYALSGRDEAPPHLLAFMDRLAPGARILELGCGSGRDAAAMIVRGFDVDPTDGSPGLALQAEARLGRPVRVMLFEALDAASAYDGVWANASLLHVPDDALADVLGRVHRALRPRGVFCATYKAGSGGARDRLGRYFNYPTQARLQAAYSAAGAWAEIQVESREDGRGYDGEPTAWLLVTAVKG